MDLRVPPLSPRLAALAAMILPGSRVADVGSGHGLLPLWLAAGGHVAHCLATEETSARLAGVARPPAHAPWAPLLDYRAGNGLAAIRPGDRIDTVVLAGLGGRKIIRALGAAGAFGSLPSRLVLQPRSELVAVRAWLSENGWRLVSERLAYDRGRFHQTLAAVRGDDADVYGDFSLSRGDLLAAGPLLVRTPSPAVFRFWSLERDRYASILDGRTGHGLERARAGLARAERVLAAISTRAL